ADTPHAYFGAAAVFTISGSSFFLSLPAMNGLHGCAFTGPGVFHTTLNWPSAFTSPMNTALCRWWFFASMVEVMPEGAVKVWPAIAAITLSVSKLFAFSTACFHMWMPMYVASIGSLVSGLSAPGSFFALAYAAHCFLNP